MSGHRDTPWDQYRLTESGLYLTDNTIGDATSSRHGLLPKLSGNADQFLNGTGGWSTVGEASLPTWLAENPDAPPGSPSADDHEYQNGDTIGGTTLGSPATAPTIVDNALKITGNAPGVTPSAVAVVYTMPAKPFTMTGKVRLQSSQTTFGVTGILLRSSVSGRFRTANIVKTALNFLNVSVSSGAYASLTSRLSDDVSVAWTGHVAYVRMEYTGSTINIYWSTTGLPNDWYLAKTETDSTHFTGGNLPDQWGVFCDSFAAVARIGFIDWVRFT